MFLWVSYILRKFNCIMQIKQTNWLQTIFSIYLAPSLSLTLVIFLRWSFAAATMRRCCRIHSARVFFCFCTFCLLFPFWSHIYNLVYVYVCIWYAYICVCVCVCTCSTSFTFIEFSFICVYFCCSLLYAVALSVVCLYSQLWVKVWIAPRLLLHLILALSSAAIAGEDWRFALTHMYAADACNI